MIGDLSPEVIGTDPQYPKIVDHSWLNVDLSKYRNYPSDNNSVRVVPKLHDLWNHNSNQTGLNLIPNAKVMPLGVRGSEEDSRVVGEIVREAKKAAMAGLKGAELAQHLRSRFAETHLIKAADELKKVSEEIGLLGNVYIDASAFKTYDEAEQFLRQHRTRLARDIILSTENMSQNLVSMFASDFHKNVVVAIEYNEDLFKKYKDHLVAQGRIPADFVIDSKDSLRKAFLHKKAAAVAEPKEEQKKKYEESDVKAGLEQMASEHAAKDVEAYDAINLSRIIPIVSFVQEQISKGKTAKDVKDMIRSKFVLDDVKVASRAIEVVLAKGGLSETHINDLVLQGKISTTLSSELKRVGKKFPIKKALPEMEKSEKPIGVQGYFHSMNSVSSDKDQEFYSKAAVEALKRGIDLSKVRAKLIQKLPEAEAMVVLSSAMSRFNAGSAGVVANKPALPEKEPLIEGPRPKKTLPDLSTIEKESQDMISFLQPGEMTVEIDSPFNAASAEVGELFNREGISEVLL